MWAIPVLRYALLLTGAHQSCMTFIAAHGDRPLIALPLQMIVAGDRSLMTLLHHSTLSYHRSP